jgi:integrase
MNWILPKPKSKSDHAMVALLIGCGLRRGEVLALALESLQQREEHWHRTISDGPARDCAT